MTHPVQEEMDRLRAALELDREDAKRYRWLRDAIIEECVEAGSFAQAKGESVVKALRSLKEESRLKNRPPCLYCGGSIRFISAAAGSAPAPKYLCQQCGTAAGVKLAMPFSGSCKECGIDLSKLATWTAAIRRALRIRRTR